MSRSKYGNRKVQADGYTFDSKAEHNRYIELQLLLENGYIKDLKVHPVFELQKPFKDRSGKRWRAITYEADFAYIDCFDGKEVPTVEDVKGAETAVFKLKRKLFLFRYPDIEFVVVPA